ncbi:MAG: efflux RND transporter periplasmic adaptor subunit [Rubricoccaceae bacterium]|nr:efflux RND transporter periplasmic adaptor subunit [Rubricoccaceae bacterium]
MRTRSLFLLPLALALAACGADDTGEAGEAGAAEAVADNALPVEVIVVGPTLFEDTIELTGAVEAPEDATLSPQAAGTLTYLAPLGAFVRAGGTVAQVDPSTAQAAVAQARAGVQAAQAQVEAARAQLDLAEDTFRRQEPLYRDSIISAWEFRGTQTQQASARAQVAQAEASVAQAQAALRQAQTALGNTRVVAPFGGTVEAQLAERGEVVGPGVPVARLVSSGGLLIEAGMPERYAGEVEVGTPVRIVPTAYEGEPIGGRVSFVGRAVNPQSRTFPIRVTLQSAEVPLRPEMVVALEVSRAVLEDVIALPLQAIVRDERGPGVLVVSESEGATVAERRAVDLGPSSNGLTVIEAGLAAGDLVIASGGVTEGDRVRVVERTGGDDLAVNTPSEPASE